MIYALIISLAVGYLTGSINTSIIVGKIKKVDIRKEGSGNAGATNTLRVMGKGAAITVFICDLLKTFIAIGISCIVAHIFNPKNSELFDYCRYIAGLGVVLGHNFPLYFGFKGGKGIVSTLGLILCLDYRIGIIITIVSVAIIAITRYVSLGSVVGAILYPIFVVAFNVEVFAATTPYYIALSVVVALLAIYRHRANIKRLLSGTESKLGQKSKK